MFCRGNVFSRRRTPKVTAIEYVDTAAQEPKVTNAPENIWLVYGDLEHDDTHQTCYRGGDVGWCDEAQFASDVMYVRADVADRLRAALVELRERIKGHPAYAELTEDEEIAIGGETAELSYLARVADMALVMSRGERRPNALRSAD